MFRAIARFDIRFRWLIVAAWIAAVLAALTLLPSLASVTQASPAQFLAADSPSVQAGALAAPFRGLDPTGTALLVAYRADGPLTAADLAALRQVEQAARRVPGVALVTEAGTAPNGQVSEALVTVPAATATDAAAAQAVVAGLRATFAGAGAPPGLDWHLAGPLAASVDAATTGNAAAGNITRFTLLFVIVLLFLVYRAVLAPRSRSCPPRSPSRSPAR